MEAMNLKAMLEESARQYGGKTAVALGDFRLSYTELDEASNRVANTLLEAGVSKGDRVAILLPNSPRYAVIYFGIVKIGAIAVPLDTKYKIRELASLFNHCQPRVLVVESPYLEPLIPVLPGFRYIESVINLSGEGSEQFLSYQAIMSSGSAQRVEVEPEPNDVAHIAYTSGPTLRPRGVMHHAVGLVVILLTSVGRGSSVIMLPGLSIDGLIEATRKEKATIFMGVPFTHALIVKKAEDEGIRPDLGSLRICASAGAPLPEDIIERFERYLGLRLIQFYGLTEGTAHVTCQALNGIGKLGSVGKALPGWELKIVDDSGQELPPYRPGEIIIKGPIMNGYYNNPQATAEAIRHGWLYTGDIGRIDADGCLFILGLKREMIITKGQNIYPSDIEEVLSGHPAVAEVAVVGIPDRVRGEVVAVAIRLKEGGKATEREIKKFCLERIANYKVPKQVIFLDSLTKTGDGKINKQSLKGYLSAAKAAEKGNT
jgi:long-chain acyl-CoA synthetase